MNLEDIKDSFEKEEEEEVDTKFKDLIDVNYSFEKEEEEKNDNELIDVNYSFEKEKEEGVEEVVEVDKLKNVNRSFGKDIFKDKKG